MPVTIQVSDFGTLPTGEIVKKFVLTNQKNVQVTLTSYGATLVGIKCPDRDGDIDDIMLGFDDLDGYLKNDYFGNTIGRFANRICKGRFTLDGTAYQLNCNDRENHLHGGFIGFNKKLWDWKEVSNGILFEVVSPDGDEKYPGTVNVSAQYTFNDDNEIKVVMKATTDKDTIINLTNHAYFNLSGQKKNLPILDHLLELNSDSYLPVDSQLIPTGEIRKVSDDPPFNFLTPKTVGTDLEKVGGYDHNFCLVPGKSFCARVYHETSGRQLEIFTSQIGVQFYSGNGLNVIGKNGNHYEPHTGLALEAQYYPDNPNHPQFPSSIVRPGESYEHFITWKVSTKL